MDTIDTLERAKTLIEKGWCQNSFAKDIYGAACNDPCDPTAEYFCMLGAIAASTDFGNERELCENAIARVLDREPETLADWNDSPGRTKAQVLAVFSTAIDLVKIESEKEKPA